VPALLSTPALLMDASGALPSRLAEPSMETGPMRYRRVSYRYGVILAPSHRLQQADVWHPQHGAVSPSQPCWRPSTDVLETPTAIHLTVELAGVDHEALDVLLFEDALIVEGQRRLPPSRAGGVYHAAEIRQGAFRLELPLPSTIDTDRVEAHYERGLLEMTLPKTSGEDAPRDLTPQLARDLEREHHGA